MTDRKFTPPTEFPAEYVDGWGHKVTILALGRGTHPLIGQDSDNDFAHYTDRGASDLGIKYDLHDLPKRTVRWQNFYPKGCCTRHSSREYADDFATPDRLCVHRIECDEDGRNPEIFVEDA